MILLATDTQDILFKSMTGDKLGLSLVKVKSVVYDLVPPISLVSFISDAIMKQSSNSVLSFNAMPIAFVALVLVNEVSAPDILVAVVGLIVPVTEVPSTSNVLICVNPVLIIWFSVAVTFAPPFSALDPEPPSNAGLLVRVIVYESKSMLPIDVCVLFTCDNGTLCN